MTVVSWPDCRNVRDLGGLPTLDGGRLRSGALIRSDSLHRLTPAGVSALESDGVGIIVDLRTAGECTDTPSPFFGRPLYRNIALLTELFEEQMEPPVTLLDGYLRIVDRCAGQVAHALTAVAQAPDGAGVLHCHAGKDRTGIVVAVALAAADVGAEAIAADYALSDRYLGPILEEELAQAPPDLQEELRAGQSRPETMRGTLAHLDAEYGGAASYLRRAGMTVADVTALRDRLRE